MSIHFEKYDGICFIGSRSQYVVRCSVGVGPFTCLYPTNKQIENIFNGKGPHYSVDDVSDWKLQHHAICSKERAWINGQIIMKSAKKGKKCYAYKYIVENTDEDNPPTFECIEEIDIDAFKLGDLLQTS